MSRVRASWGLLMCGPGRSRLGSRAAQRDEELEVRPGGPGSVGRGHSDTGPPPRGSYGGTCTGSSHLGHVGSRSPVESDRPSPSKSPSPSPSPSLVCSSTHADMPASKRSATCKRPSPAQTGGNEPTTLELGLDRTDPPKRSYSPPPPRARSRPGLPQRLSRNSTTSRTGYRICANGELRFVPLPLPFIQHTLTSPACGLPQDRIAATTSPEVVAEQDQLTDLQLIVLFTKETRQRVPALSKNPDISLDPKLLVSSQVSTPPAHPPPLLLLKYVPHALFHGTGK